MRVIPSFLAAPFLATLFFATLFFVACGQEQQAASPKAPASPSTEAPGGETELPLEKLHIRNPNDEVVVTFRWNSEEVQILFTEADKMRFFRSRLEESRQRRYFERGVGPVAMVHSSPNDLAFNIRSAQGNIWWRVRLGKKMAQIENAAQQPVFQLRRPKNEVIRVVREDSTALGRAMIRKSRVRILDADGSLIHKVGRGAPDSLLYGLMVAPDLEPMARYILMAELLVRGR